MKKPAFDPADGRVRLVQQTRVGDGFCYYFMCRGVMLAVAIRPGDAGTWSVDVSCGTPPERIAVVEHGSSRREGVARAGEAWAAAVANQHVPDFDWHVVTAALTDVAAI